MSIKYVFNPFTGNFDAIDVLDTSGFASAVPTVQLPGETFEIFDRRQALFAYPIQGDVGSMILQGEDSILIGVD